MKILPQSTVSGFHPLVGHAYSSNDTSFLLENESIENGVIKISLNPNSNKTVLILGGSTSDIYYNGSWVRPFSSLIYKDFSAIFSCACVGYSSSQDLLRLLEFIISIKPSIIISLNGINDFGLIQAATASGAKFPYIHWYHNQLFSYISKHFPTSIASKKVNAISSDTLVRYPYCVDDGYPIWEQNISTMNSIAKYNNIPFYSFLQPCLGYSPLEVGMNSIEEYYLNQLTSTRKWYLPFMKSFYDKAVNFCSISEFAFDLTKSLGSSPSNMFDDCRHLSYLGNLLLAKAIYAKICL